MYKRAKKSEANKPSKRVLQINVGSIYDSYDLLKSLCDDKSNELVNSIELNVGEKLEVVFWTDDIPELICVSKFTKDTFGMISYQLDFSQSTLF